MAVPEALVRHHDASARGDVGCSVLRANVNACYILISYSLSMLGALDVEHCESNILECFWFVGL